MTIAAVRSALSDAVGAITGLSASPYMVDNVNPPHAVVLQGGFDPRMVLSQTKAPREFTVRLFASRVAEVAGQKLLDTFCELSGATSVIAAIQGDSSLNGGATADYAEVQEVSALQVVTVGGIDYLAVDFTVEVVFA